MISFLEREEWKEIQPATHGLATIWCMKWCPTEPHRTGLWYSIYQFISYQLFTTCCNFPPSTPTFSSPLSRFLVQPLCPLVGHCILGPQTWIGDCGVTLGKSFSLGAYWLNGERVRGDRETYFLNTVKRNKIVHIKCLIHCKMLHKMKVELCR